MTDKPCPRCGVIDRSPQNRCANCKRIRARAIYRADPAGFIAYQREWRAMNLERDKARQAVYYRAHAEAIKARRRKRYAAERARA